MSEIETEKKSLPQKSKYRFREVTYHVTAHYCSNSNSLKSKINHLIKAELQKADICTFAASQENE